MKFYKKCIIFTLLLTILQVLIFPTAIAIPEEYEPNFSSIYSKNFLVFDRNSKNVILESNGFNKSYIASTTKIMTCILAIEHGNLNDLVEVSKKAASVSGSKLNLKANSKIYLKDLLYGLMLRSGNDAAIAIAEHISGSLDNFSILMNQKAKELNLKTTHLSSPHGLDNENHYSSCYDLAVLTDYALNNDLFKKIVSTNSTHISLNGNSTHINNTNNLLRDYSGFYGVKTGFTFNAGRCLVSAYKNNDIDIIIVTLDANSNIQRTKDTIFLKNFILKNYEVISLKNEIFSTFNSFLKENKELYFKSFPESIITLSDSFLDIDKFIIQKNSNIDFKINIQPILSYNNFIGNKIGTFNIYNDGKILSSIDIILSSEIKKLDFKFYFYYLLSEIV